MVQQTYRRWYNSQLLPAGALSIAGTFDVRTENVQRRIPQLDAVRGLAILVVMAHNISLKYPVLHSEQWTRDGWMGVDLFFALSGLLITGSLLDTKESANYFKNFYVRRCLRIWPLYYALIFFMFVVVRFLSPAEFQEVVRTSSPWWAFPLFLQNFLLPISTNAAGPLAVTWSLAIEEQFYLFWAPVVRFCSSTNLLRIAIAEVCISPVLRYYLSLHQVNLYTNVFCRLDSLMAGAILAIMLRSRNFVPSKWLSRAWILFVTAGLLAFVTESLHVRWIVFTFTALASGSFIFVSLFSPQKWIQTVMANRFLIYSGIISYGLYLLHKIPSGVVQTLHLDRHPWLPFPFIFVTSYLLAALSWTLLEKPFLSLKRFFQAPAADRDRLEIPGR
jgi:peptidoglycan/LPS O-acetylase OafA/YrhL